MGIKRQVQVGAHVSAQISQSSDGKLLRFSNYSAFASKVLRPPVGGSPPPDRRKFRKIRSFFVIPPLIGAGCTIEDIKGSP